MPITLVIALITCAFGMAGIVLAMAAVMVGLGSILEHMQSDPPYRPICISYPSINADWIRAGFQHVCDMPAFVGFGPLYDWPPVFGFGSIAAVVLIFAGGLLVVTVCCKAAAIGLENM